MTIEGAIGLFLGALLLRLVGFIADFWLLVGAVVLVALWAYLARKYSEQKRLIKWIFIVLILLNISNTVGKNIYREHFEPYSRMSRAAVERARLAADLETALKINPEMLKSRMEVTNHLQWVQDKYVGKGHEAKLANIRASLANGTISPEAAWQQMMAVVKETKEYREKITEAVSEISPPLLKKPDGKDGIPWYDNIGTRGWLALLGGLLLGATILLPSKIAIPGRKFWGFMGIVMLLVAALYPHLVSTALPPPPSGQRPAPTARATTAADRVFTGYTLPCGKALVMFRQGEHRPAAIKIWTWNGTDWRWDTWPANEPAWFVNNDEPPKVQVHLELLPGLRLTDFKFQETDSPPTASPSRTLKQLKQNV
jgi:uncharacterized protein YpmB